MVDRHKKYRLMPQKLSCILLVQYFSTLNVQGSTLIFEIFVCFCIITNVVFPIDFYFYCLFLNFHLYFIDYYYNIDFNFANKMKKANVFGYQNTIGLVQQDLVEQEKEKLNYGI